MTTIEIVATLIRAKRLLIASTAPVSPTVAELDRIIALIKSTADDVDAVLVSHKEEQ